MLLAFRVTSPSPALKRPCPRRNIHQAGGAVLTEMERLRQGRACGALYWTSAPSKRPPAGLGRAESAGSLRAALLSPGELRPLLQPRIWPLSSGITQGSAQAHFPRTLQPRVTPLFLSGGPELGKMHAILSRTRPPWPRPWGLESRLSRGLLKLRISDWRQESSFQGLWP